MDAFVTRNTSAGPARSSSSRPSKRLPPSSSIPSFYSTHKDTKPYESKQRQESSEASTSQLKVPAAHSAQQLKETIKDIKKSLRAEDNPITHSTSSQVIKPVRPFSVIRENQSSLNSYAASRNGKLKAQGEEAETTILAGVRAYINGATTPLIGNLDLIKLVQRNGGEIKYNFSKRGCTHLICSSGLSASKTHKEMASRSVTKVVTPE
ncbi:MAG: hypothetical protein CYPHOPRED_002248, partial [Cyphobasidiales sp. Tagirdzhanova-0007]